MNFKTLLLKDAIAQELLNSLAADFESLLEESEELIVRIYEGDTVLNESIDLYDLFYEENVAGIIVNGNLTVNGTIIDYELDTYSCFLQIKGSLSCHTLASGCAEILIAGDANITEALVAFYNHGTLEIDGDLHARLLVVDDHGISIYGKTNATTYCRGWHIKGADYTDWREIMLPEVADELLDENDYLFAGDVRLLKKLQDQDPVFKEKVGDFSADNNPVARVTTWAEIKPLIQHLECEYEEYPFAIAEKQSEQELEKEKFLLYEGRTILDELDLVTEEYMGIIVLGDLIVKGSIISEETDGATSLIVLGNLKAKNMCVGGQLIYITGYVDVEEMIMGIYNHGEMYAKSYVWCPVVINDDYHFYFTHLAGVKVLEFTDDDDKDIIREKLIDDLFGEEDDDWFVHYSVIREGKPLLKQQSSRNTVTKEDLAGLMDIPLFGPQSNTFTFVEDGWYIKADKGGYIDDDGAPVYPSLIAIHTEKDHHLMWYMDEEDTINTLIKDANDEFVPAQPKWRSWIAEMFTTVEAIILRKVRWNNRHIKVINNEELWALIWMFRNSQDDEEFRGIANEVFTRVLHGALFPFAYVYITFAEKSEERGLAQSPDLIHAVALLDGLIANGLITEVATDVPLAEASEQLNVVTEYTWGYSPELDEAYENKPIDRAFICKENEELLSVNGALLRLDIGTRSYMLAGMNIDEIDLATERLHTLHINAKYFTTADEKEEASLKQVAAAMLAIAKENNTEALHLLRDRAPVLWSYVYNERGDIAFWQEWIDDFKSWLILKAGSSHTFRGEENIAPLHPDVEFWIDWCEKYDVIKETSDTSVPDEE